MSQIFEFIELLSLPVLFGLTVILLTGWLGTFFLRSPISRQRFGELSLVVGLVWLLSPLLPQTNRPSNTDGLSFADIASLPSQSGDLQPSNDPPDWKADESDILAPATPRDLENEANKFSTREVGGEPDESQGTKSKIQTRAHSHSNPLQPEYDVGSKPESAGSTNANWSAVRGVIVKAYMLGSLITLCWLVGGHILLWCRVRNSRPIEKKYQDFVESKVKKRAPIVLVSNKLSRVFSFGIIRPTIVVPVGILEQCDDETTENILTHEIGHIRQLDAVGQWIMNLSMLFLYFHPMYWLVRRRICFERELVVDDWAAEQTGKQTYVSVMIWLAKRQSQSSVGPLAAIGAVGSNESCFFRRIKVLILRSEKLATSRSLLSTICQTGLMAGLLCVLVLYINIPNSIAQENRQIELQAEMSSVQPDREKLMQQIADLEARNEQLKSAIQSLNDEMEEKRNQLAIGKAKKQENSGKLKRLDELAMVIARLTIESEDIKEQLAHKARSEQAREWLSNRDVRIQPPGRKIQPNPDKSVFEEFDDLLKMFSQHESTPAQKRTPLSSELSGQLAEMDLAIFVSRLTDASVERDVLKVELQELNQSPAGQSVEKHDVRLCEIKLAGAERKVEVLHNLAKSEVERSMVHLQYYESELVKMQEASRNADRTRLYALASAKINQLRARIKTLEELLR